MACGPAQQFKTAACKAAALAGNRFDALHSKAVAEAI
jgi:hypothetical protein